MSLFTAVFDASDISSAGGALVSDTQKTISATAYTILADDAGKVLRFTAASAVTVTLPDDIDAGANFVWRQVGTGQITFSPAAGVSLRNFDGYTKSAGRYAEGVLSVDTSAEWYLAGACA